MPLQVTSGMCTIETGCVGISCDVGFTLGSGSFTTYALGKANWRSTKGNIYLCHCTWVCIGLITFEIHF